MTYALSWPLQQALYDLMRSDAACQQHFGPRIYDAAPPFLGEQAPEGVYLTFGDEEVADWSTGTDAGAVHLVKLAVHAPRRGFSDAKQAAAAISDAILGGALVPSRGRIVNVRFVDARTSRAEADALRQIDMRFRITIEDTA